MLRGGIWFKPHFLRHTANPLPRFRRNTPFAAERLRYSAKRKLHFISEMLQGDLLIIG
jgi:hypothetical protein